ncbi:MAG: dihydropteroate synthase [Candidatus Omnitrophica bacterium]|nr:dihydropteroate synthase [Candidatus Omnitrophota bacterium]
MIIIGEKINSTRRHIKEAIAGKRLDVLLEEAGSQLLSGAQYIDINTAASIAKEKDDLIWLLENVQEKFGCGLSIDSPDPGIVKEAIGLCAKRPFVNSITGEKSRIGFMKSFMSCRQCFIIALSINDDGIPDDVEGRVSVAEEIIKYAALQGVDRRDVFIDPLVKPVSTEPGQARCFLEAVKILKGKGISCIGGLSNISFGLPRRDILNAVFIRLAIDAGIDAAILDPTQKQTGALLSGKDMPKQVFSIAQDAILGKDEYSMNYIKAFRAGLLEF